MASSVFTVNGTTAPAEVQTTWGGTVNLALVSTAGVTTISWSIESTSSAVITKPTITPPSHRLAPLTARPQARDNVCANARNRARGVYRVFHQDVCVTAP